MENTAVKTPLYDEHIKAGGKIVPFAGFLLPVQYKDGVIKEHMCVRKEAGIFDVSHMGEAILRGKDALLNLNYIMTNKFDSMNSADCRYTLMLNEDGGQIDDLIVYKITDEEYLLVLNASNTKKDIEWISAHLKGECTLINTSDSTAQIALQGPLANEIMAKICTGEPPQKNYSFIQNLTVAGADCLVSRTGYTGEDGFEIYTHNDNATAVWQALIDAGAKPCGLGCRDTLRLEAAMPLYGHELSEYTHVCATGLSFAIKLEKDDFIGKSAALNPPQNLPVRVGLKALERGIVREGAEIYLSADAGVQDVVGTTTSGTHCPYLGHCYAMAYVAKEHAANGNILYTDVRGKRIKMQVVPLPFYKRGQ